MWNCNRCHCNRCHVTGSEYVCTQYSHLLTQKHEPCNRYLLHQDSLHSTHPVRLNGEEHLLRQDGADQGVHLRHVAAQPAEIEGEKCSNMYLVGTLSMISKGQIGKIVEASWKWGTGLGLKISCPLLIISGASCTISLLWQTHKIQQHAAVRMSVTCATLKHQCRNVISA